MLLHALMAVSVCCALAIPASSVFAAPVVAVQSGAGANAGNHAPVPEGLPETAPAGAAESARENAPAEAPLPIPPVAPRIAEGDQYDRCMDMLADDPAGADALAVAWKDGGEAATQCHGLAQIELGNPAAGAALLTDLAARSAASPGARAEVFGQAAQAWTMAGDADQAFTAAAQAIALSPDDPELRVTHAIAALAVHRSADAIDDLTMVLATDPKRADALTLRATAYRQSGAMAQAEADIALACGQEPDNPDALLERGIIRQRQGDFNGARADWQKVAAVSPDTSAADLAQQDLALLEAGPVQ